MASGNTLLSSAEAPHAFVHVGSTWQEQVLPTDCDEAGTVTERYVALDGDTALVSGNQQLCIFVRDDASWSTQQVLPFPGDVRYHQGALALSDDTAMIGAVSTLPNGVSGKVYVYERASSVWSLSQTLSRDQDLPSNADFGSNIALGGNTAIISGGKGPHLFVRQGVSWSLQQTLVSEDPNIRFAGFNHDTYTLHRDDFPFPDVFQLSDDRAVIACATKDYSNGSCELVRAGDTWTHDASRTQIAPPPYRVLSVRGDLALLGAPGRTEDYIVSAPIPNGPTSDESLGAALVARSFGATWEPLLELPTRHVNFGFTGALGEFGAVVGSQHSEIMPYHEGWYLVGPGWLSSFELSVAEGTCDIDAHCATGHCVEHLCVPFAEPTESGGAGGRGGGTLDGPAPEASGGTEEPPSGAEEPSNEAEEPVAAAGDDAGGASPSPSPPSSYRARGGRCSVGPVADAGSWSLIAALLLGLGTARRGRRA